MKSDFPMLREHPDLVYLDNAATTHKPAAVLEAMDSFYRRWYANVHRGVYRIAEEATARYEEARRRAARFLGGVDPSEVVFTRGATESLNLVAAALESRVREGDRILVTALEHHSNLLPWRRLAARRGAELSVCPVTDRGDLDLEAFHRLLSSRPRIVAFTLASNALGTIPPAQEIVTAARAAGAITVADAAQAVPCMKVDAVRLGCDFLAFSGHKMVGPMGIGVLFGRRELLESLPPYMTGGEMVRRVTDEGAEWAEPPHRFEAGTPHVAGAVGLAAAMDYLEGVGLERILAHEKELVEAAREGLGAIRGVKVLGRPKHYCGILSFVIEGVHPHDVAGFLAARNIAVRAGRLCAEPLLTRLGVPAVVRASFYLYNDRSEVDRLTRAVNEAVKFFGGG